MGLLQGGPEGGTADEQKVRPCTEPVEGPDLHPSPIAGGLQTSNSSPGDVTFLASMALHPHKHIPTHKSKNLFLKL